MARPRPIRLLQVTDPHLYGDESRSIYGVNTALSLRRVLAQAMGTGLNPPDAILATGDIAEDHGADAYANFRRVVGSYGLPVYCLPGNHDDPALMSTLLDDDGFQYCGSAEFGRWGALFLDTHLARNPAGRLSDAELARLDQELSRFGDRPTLICLHHPPVDVGSAWLDGVGLTNAAAALQVMDRHANVKVVLAGHVHQEFEQARGDVRMLTTPSTCAQFTPLLPRCVMDLRPPGYRWLQLFDDGTINTTVAWLQDWVVTERPPDDRYEEIP